MMGKIPSRVFKSIRLSTTNRCPLPGTERLLSAGNSVAQTLADVSKETDPLWIAPEEPRFHPDDVDGWHVFGVATHGFAQTPSGDIQGRTSHALHAHAGCAEALVGSASATACGVPKTKRQGSRPAD